MIKIDPNISLWISCAQLFKLGEYRNHIEEFLTGQTQCNHYTYVIIIKDGKEKKRYQAEIYKDSETIIIGDKMWYFKKQIDLFKEAVKDFPQLPFNEKARIQ